MTGLGSRTRTTNPAGPVMSQMPTDGPKCRTLHDRTLPYPEYVDVNQVDLGVKQTIAVAELC